MSDAINDIEKENEQDRLSKIVIKEAAESLKRLRSYVNQYNNLKMDIEKLGYIIKENNNFIEIWKQII